MRKILTIACSVLFFSIYSQAQLSIEPSVVASSGNYYESSSMTISWTVGELAITTLTGNNLILTQGFQQPTIMGTGIDKDEFDGKIFVYPNPVQNELFVRFDVERSGNYILELQDVTGRIMSQTMQKPINPGDIIKLNTSAFSPGMYLLRVITTDGRNIQVTSIRKL
jgi:hypothetical protein